MMFIAINFMCKASLKPISSITLATGPQLGESAGGARSLQHFVLS